VNRILSQTPEMDKQRILDAIREALVEEFDSFRSASKRTREEGNDAESRSEGKYDTRSIEENYLADGLAKQAAHAAQALAAYEALPVVEFAENDPVDLGALVLLQFPDEQAWFFLGPAGGGIEVRTDDGEVTVLTQESPLGGQLIGRRAGDSTASPAARILRVC
jgi:transcription elongation GreA/GreB family factor